MSVFLITNTRLLDPYTLNPLWNILSISKNQIGFRTTKVVR